MKLTICAATAVLGLAFVVGNTSAAPPSAAAGIDTYQTELRVQYRSTMVRGIKIFYRETGRPGKPVILLLHGFPSSSFMYRELLPLLAQDFHLIAPDYPGAGFSEHPSADKFTPSFANLADLMSDFVQQIGLSRFTIYMQDFGGPVGFRMALKHPESVNGLIIQNANAYLEGIAPEQLKGIMAPERKQTEQLVSRDFTLFMYRTGARLPLERVRVPGLAGVSAQRAAKVLDSLGQKRPDILARRGASLPT
jgi:pimeloyl-ACP methyl ester carboxylesterase